MRNKSILKLLKSFFFLYIIILSFNSCKNFLSGSELIETLDETIKYENAKKKLMF